MATMRAGPAAKSGQAGQPLAPETPLVLHISADYPDPHRGATTTAVERLVRGTPAAEHIVVSLNRTSRPDKTYFRDCGMVDGVRLFAFRYFAPPFGVALAWSMEAVGRQIARMLAREGLHPRIVHAHKFAFEGLAALWLVRRLGEDVALLVSVRGEAESKILRYKPAYRPRLQQIADRASRIYYVSAWFRPILEARLVIDPQKEALLPNIVGNTRASIPECAPGRRFVSVFNLDIRARKGFASLLEAFRIHHAVHPEIGLDLIGDGSEESLKDVRAQIEKHGLGDCVRLLGRMDNDELTAALPSYLALLLPSFNETFGMVYLEALFAGIPILYGRGTGIDGYLDGLDVGVAATPGDIAQIAAGIERLQTGNATYRAAIRAGAGELHARFDPQAVLERYGRDLLAFAGPAS